MQFDKLTDATAAEFSILSQLRLSSIRNCNVESILLTPVYCRFACLNSAQTNWPVPKKQHQLCGLNLLINNQALNKSSFNGYLFNDTPVLIIGNPNKN